MKTSLNGARLGAESFSFFEMIDLAQRHGFDGIDYGISSAMNAGKAIGGPHSIGEYFRTHNVAPATIGLEVEWRRDEATFQEGMGTLQEKAAFAEIVGTTRCLTWMPPAASDVVEFDRKAVRRFGEIARILEQYGIRLGLEWVGPHHLRAEGENAMGPESWIYTLPDTLDLIDRIGVPTVGLLVDSYHCYTTGVTESELANLSAAEIVHVHINDAPIGVGPTGARDGERVLPGAGEIDLPGFLRALEATGYDGFVAAEILAPQNLAETPDAAAEQVRASLRRLGL